MQIGTVELGSIPRVIVALGENYVEGLERALRLKIDLIEARLDLLPEKTPDEFKKFLDSVADYGFYAVSTLRPVWEGGKFEGTESERLKLLKRVVSHPATGAVDVELRSEILDDVRELCKEKGKKLIVSYHDFKKTPENSEIEEILERAKGKGADIVKVAFMGRVKNDASRVCCLLSKFEFPKIFIVMGEFGAFTRVVGFSFGSLLTYTFFGRPVAPGQIEAERLIKLLSNLYSDYRKQREKFFPQNFLEVI
ncbi:3-dehydroquinate dehydratase [Balnearium lithotrophicum]|uniref:3-dehydroquinate dehydratase n=1 Tax=Balnearium lithotrophicum TaxID=223788 RepID=A0A521B8D3_9BACT|nr:type I 3-dehydroquinate dehydratase [Balnearium lithotrophicum]SMO43329.1 3-dehydroquinate dehydratase [Balnearium lithotrophicum]